MLDDDDQAICCFKELGECSIPAELESGELPAQVKALEHFVCRVYNLATTEDFASIGMFKGLINRVNLSQYVNF